MFFKWRRNKKSVDEKQEAEIKAIKEDTFKSVDDATKSTKKAADVLSELKDDKDVTLRIFYATGGDRRGLR